MGLFSIFQFLTTKHNLYLVLSVSFPLNTIFDLYLTYLYSRSSSYPRRASTTSHKTLFLYTHKTPLSFRYQKIRIQRVTYSLHMMYDASLEILTRELSIARDELLFPPPLDLVLDDFFECAVPLFFVDLLELLPRRRREECEV